MTNRVILVAEGILTIWLFLWAARLLISSIRWPMAIDGPVISYLTFLMHHGMVPYRDIIEVQFPGTYLLYGIQSSLFGYGDLAFRLCDLGGLGVAIAAMFVIVRRKPGWFGAVVGGALFTLIHVGAELSLTESGQRDFYVACLLLLGVACNIEAVRRNMPWLMLAFGFCVSFSATIKPTGGLFLLLLPMTALELRRKGSSYAKYMWMSGMGVSIPMLLVIAVLMQQHALIAFFQLSWQLVPAYAELFRKSYIQLSVFMFVFASKLFWFALAVAGLFIALQPKVERDWEERMLFVCFLLGASAYFIQGKGFRYHALSFFAFGCLWSAYVLVANLRRDTLKAWAGAALLALCLSIPFASEAPTFRQDSMEMLQADLSDLRAAGTSGEVQCLDVTDGCLNVLLRMNVVMPTGFIGDYYFFLPEKYAIGKTLRQRFMTQMEQKLPRIIILTDQQWPRAGPGYEQLQQWPELNQLLAHTYHLQQQRSAAYSFATAGYRLYVRN